VLPILERSTNP